MRPANHAPVLGVLALLAIAVAVGAWLIQSEPHGTLAAGPSVVTSEADEPAQTELETIPLESTRAAIVEADAEAAAIEPEPAVVAATLEAGASSSATRTLEVAIVVIDVDGTELRDADGAGQAFLWAGASGFVELFELRAGRFTLPVIEGMKRLEIRECTVDGEPLDCREASLTLPHDGPLVFVLHRPAGLRLRVIGSDTRVDLTEVQIVTGASFEHDELEHPSGRAMATIVTGRRSPMELEPRIGRDTDFWVHAPGYAWQRVQLDLARGGERVVELVPGGAVECTILGAVLPEGATLRGWRGEVGGTPDADYKAVRDEKLEIEGLTPGEWCFKVQKGRWFQDPLDLAVVTVTVDAGLTQRVALTVAESAEAPARVTVRGVVRIDDSWHGLDRLGLSLQPEGEVERWDTEWRHVTPVRSGSEFTWGVRSLFVGRYMVVVSPSEHRQMLDVTADGSNEFTIEVPPPGDVEVMVVDDATGGPAAIARVVWHAEIPAGIGGFGLENAPYDPELGARFQAPIGKLSLQVWQEGFANLSENVEVVRGVNRFTLRIKRACGVRVEFFDGETPVPISDYGLFKVVAVGHDGRQASTSDTWAQVSAPGRYRITFESIPGFRSVPPQDIDIPAGEMITVRAKLERNQ